MSKKLFCNDWSFVKLPIDTDIDTLLQNKKDYPFQRVDIPHDWLIYQVNDLYETSLGVYTKDFTIEKSSEILYTLYFEAVYFNCQIYINDKKAYEWKYGYSTFYFDTTEFLNDGANNITVLVFHEAPNSRWYSGAGIIRPVYLIEQPKSHIKTDGVYFSAKKENGIYNALIETEITLAEKDIYIEHEITDDKGNIIAKLSKCPVSENAISDAEYTHSATFGCPDVCEWSHKTPVCYTLSTRLYNETALLDETTCNVGFRTISFTPDGFYINGEKLKLNGVCLHHDLGCLGAVSNRAATKRQLLSMKEMGVNAIRTSHNMPTKDFMELCDELGFYVDSEAFDIWRLKKNEYDYARFFNEWHERDVKSWVRRDRNHPSIIMWSIGNEIYDTHASKDAPELTRHLMELVLKYDPQKNGMATIGSNYIPWEGAQKCADILKLSGYNYCENLYEEHHKKFPDHIIYGSETAARGQSRGIYHFPMSVAVKTHADMQCSSLENSRSGTGDRTPQSSIIWDRDTDFSCGQFIWTGSDYIGEPTPYKTKNAYYGQIDTAGLKKDTYYLYQSCWSDKKVLHLFPYWDFNEGEIIDVCTYTNQPTVELFVNGVSQGKQHIDVKKGKTLMASWQLPYTYGEILAIAYDENGNEILRDKHHSFKDSHALVLKCDKTTLLADGVDVAFIEISAVDEDGYPVENARDRVFVEVSDEARLLGLDSGDSTDYEEYKGTSKKLFSGKLVAYIGSTKNAGEITVRVTGNGVKEATLKLNSIPANTDNGVSCLQRNTDTTDDALKSQIPVRKISLKADATKLTKDTSESLVTAEIYPQNATDKALTWLAVTETGVETNIASIEANGNSCKVTAAGDGTFYLRCMASNGKSDPEIISELCYHIEGLGMATLNPYNFIYGTLYKEYNIMPGEDLEGGIAPKINSYVGFSRCDFGETGTDTFTLPIIYWFSSDPLYIKIWSGIPHENTSTLLAEGTYSHEFVWATYFDLTLKSNTVVKGIHDIYIEFILDSNVEEQRISFKGFSCEARVRSYEKIMATDNDRIYGDSFTLEEDMISHIGNNVSLEFDEMNFTDGFSSLTICGRTHNELDSLHVFFIDETGRERRLIEFTKSEKLCEKTFPLDGLKGRYKVTIMFLPGSDFDFAWLKFNK